MDTRKVQRLGPSTLAMTLPADWTSEQDVNKGDELTIRRGTKGTLMVMSGQASSEENQATIHAESLDAGALERAIIAQYVLGRRIIHIEHRDGTLSNEQINAVYGAENQLMGLGVIEETPERIAIRCSVDAEDFTLDSLLQRLESTGRTMRGEAIKSLVREDSDLAERALNRERQANKIFVLLLRLIFTALQNPNHARELGITSGFPLIGYRSIAKNLELTADNAEDIAEIALSTEGRSLPVDDATIRRIQDFTDDVDELTRLAVDAAIQREYDLTIEVRSQYHAIGDTEQQILADLPELSNQELLHVRDVLTSLQQTAQYAMRNAEIAANLALNSESAHVTIGEEP